MAASFFDWYREEREREVQQWAAAHPGREPSYTAVWPPRLPAPPAPNGPVRQFGDLPLERPKTGPSGQPPNGRGATVPAAPNPHK